MLPFKFDFKKPDYPRVVGFRIAMLRWMRGADVDEKDRRAVSLERLGVLAAHYRNKPADMIEDWGCTYDPRNVGEEEARTTMPFILFPKQREWVEWAVERWLNKEEGITEKSRDMGLSWLAVALTCCLCILYEEMAIGFGSRKEEYVDKAGFPKALFFKARLFMDMLPVEFQAGWSRRTDAHMRISFPATKSVITGEAGDNIGRGDRTGIYLTDEDAQIEHPDLVDAALSATTNCRIRISSANGTTNSFYTKRQQYEGTKRLFTLHWRDNPLKSQEWYNAKSEEVNNPVVMAQEYDINYTASTEGVLIPAHLVAAAMDAHIKLGFGFDGERSAALDLADGGKDKNAICGAHGVVIEYLEDWSGQHSDMMATAERAFAICDLRKYEFLRYDASGLGAHMKGDARVLNTGRIGKRSIPVVPWNAMEIIDPDRKFEGTDRTNREFFANGKAQGYFDLMGRFARTYKATEMVKKGSSVREALKKFPPATLISFDTSAIDPKALARATIELSQPTADPDGAGKWNVDKKPDGSKSPNFADCIMMRFIRSKKRGVVSREGLEAIMAATG